MTPEEFNLKVLTSTRPLVIYFWAPWCVPCRGMSPRIQETAARFADQVDFIKINADESSVLIRSLNIMTIPTLMVYANGKVLFRKSGAQDNGALTEIFSAAAAVRPPVLMLKPFDRMVRAGSGLILILAGLSLPGSPNALLILAGGIIGFTAVYDRCPIYRAVSAQVKSLIRRIRGEATTSQ